MSLQTRLGSLITAIGADIKALNTRIDGVSGGTAPPSVKVSALPAATTPDGTELMPLIQGSISKQATVSQIRGSSSGAAPDWAGKLHSASGNGEPEFEWQWDALWSPQTTLLTPTGVTATVGRVWYYRSPYAITVNRLRWLATVGSAGASNFRFGMYNMNGTQLLAPQTLSYVVAAAAGTWQSHALPGTVLAANTGYYCMLSATAAATTHNIKASGIPGTAGGYPALDAATPPNLRVSGASPTHKTWFAQVALTNGVQPATMPALVRGNAWTVGGLPTFFFDNENTA